MLTQFLCNFALCKRARTGCASALQRHTLTSVREIQQNRNKSNRMIFKHELPRIIHELLI